jgi:thioredoxin-related protein
MKKFLLIIMVVLTIFACNKQEEKRNDLPTAVQKTNDLPLMPITIKGQPPKSAKALTGNTILIFYQPDCDHCQREAKEISDRLDQFKDFKIYFTTTESFEAMDRFASDYNLSGKPNVFFAQTSIDAILGTVGPISAPSIFIYQDQKLVKHLDGETPVSEILKYL